ncbi:hypothetical protein WH52_04705 [Tenacibaculum holothuriorum]|uniref:DUF6973 domain-containing protein n=1 Tax=Tenacibaculum holothuriorum TaxID=1635173 RepID=A0A1Y2PEP2_9FLAO|nr:hypothetical protein [Tenacibaculum holothuriorum]OSY88966.1 hypothetical protein WH52_04705 [Tenacibaculum holothuriorum]
MKKYFFLLFLVSIGSFGQTNWQKFKNLSGPKKMWVFFHPFKAKKALNVSREANRVSDSIKNSPLLDKDGAGGQVDAFRHAYWMACLRQEIGESAARSLGKAHEKENYQTYKKRKLEDGVIPDKVSSEMDLFNNEIGLSLAIKGNKTSQKGLVYRIINAIKSGKLRVIKKDKKGRFLTCDGALISKEKLKGKWENDKCLVKSNYK